MSNRARRVGRLWLRTTAAAIAIALTTSALAQDSSKTYPAEESKAAANARKLERLKRSATLYRIAPSPEGSKPLTLREEPVLRWNQSERTTNGALFVWTANGRPEAVASFEQSPREKPLGEKHTFQSLSAAGLSASRGRETVWTPKQPGIKFAPIPGAPKPAAASADRLRQMTSLAGEFQATYTVTDDPGPLSLFPKPLYRYDTKRADVPDGVLFAFLGNPRPKLLLLIEARPIDSELVWHYGFARISPPSLSARHKDQAVWEAVQDWYSDDPDKTYTTIQLPDGLR